MSKTCRSCAIEEDTLASEPAKVPVSGYSGAPDLLLGELVAHGLFLISGTSTKPSRVGELPGGAVVRSL